MISLCVTKGEESDIPRLIECEFAAFYGDAYHDAVNPGGNTAEVRAQAAQRLLVEMREQPQRSYQELIKCVREDTGVIIGFSKWEFHARERPEEEWSRRDPADWCVEGKERQVAEMFLGTSHRQREHLWKGKPHGRE